jgi:hypothetical protein
MFGQKIVELQHSLEFMKEEHSTEVRQARMITAEFDVSRRILHSANF